MRQTSSSEAQCPATSLRVAWLSTQSSTQSPSRIRRSRFDRRLVAEAGEEGAGCVAGLEGVAVDQGQAHGAVRVGEVQAEIAGDDPTHAAEPHELDVLEAREVGNERPLASLEIGRAHDALPSQLT
jgi:hypothetical protein